MEFERIKREIQKHSSPKKAETLKTFFSEDYTHKNDYFLGVPVPTLRKIAKQFNPSFQEIKNLLQSDVHEHRMIASIFLVEEFKKEPEKVFEFYLRNAKSFYNWDLVDLTAPRIMGEFLLKNKKEKNILKSLIKSSNLWERRIALVSTLRFVKEGEFGDALTMCEFALEDKHPLMHKAAGWVLREIGKKDEPVLKDFLEIHYDKIPRITLRYAIEKFPEVERKRFLDLKNER